MHRVIGSAPLDKRVRLTPEIVDYVVAQVEPPSAAQRRLIDATAALGGVAEMQIPHEQGTLLTLLAKVVNARTILEIGTFTGYSTLALARGLAAGGRVITLDITTEWSDIATLAWTEEGVADRIEQRFGEAARTLAELPEEPFVDLAFVDADKPGYIGYWDLLVPRIVEGGLILADNVLYAGEAAAPDATGNGKAIQEFNAHVRADDRVESVMLTVADGLTIARKKPAGGAPS